MEHIMNNRLDSIAHLKRRIDRLARPTRTGRTRLFPLGLDSLDARLGGGLASGAVHEVLGSDGTVASGLALMLALRAVEAGKPILWIVTDRGVRDTGRLYGPGLADLGADPDQIIIVHAPDEMAALRAGADIIGCSGVGAAILDVGAAKKLDLTASRRLALAAEKSGVTSFILRAPGTAIASAASTRWGVSAASSVALAGNAPGQTALHLELLRHRGGIAPFDLFVEWDRDQLSFFEPAPLSRALPASAQRGQMAA